MSTYETMSVHLETERLILRPWAESDAAELRALHSERCNGTPTVEYTRTLIAKQAVGEGARPLHPQAVQRAARWCGRRDRLDRASVQVPQLGLPCSDVRRSDPWPDQPARPAVPRCCAASVASRVLLGHGRTCALTPRAGGDQHPPVRDGPHTPRESGDPLFETIKLLTCTRCGPGRCYPGAGMTASTDVVTWSARSTVPALFVRQ